MKRSLIALTLVYAFSIVAAPQDPDVVRVALSKRQLPSGPQTVVLSIYTSRLGGSPIASEARVVDIDANGAFTTPLGALAATARSEEERWLGVRVFPGDEGERVPLTNQSVSINVVTDAAITANGIIESIATGFRFPDATVQATAANAGGAPQTIGTSNAAGAATTFSRTDHVHAHGNQSGGTLHSTATTSVAGFLSASDKTKLDGTVAYVRTIVVSPVVGDTIASGTALVNALNGISGNSATNPYLLKIEPGVYDIGASGLTMKTNVDIEGSGENATFIVASRGNSSLSSAAAAIIGAINAELRNLTVSNTAPGSLQGVGLFATSNAVVRLRDVTLNSTGAATTSYGIFANGSSSITLIRTTITATGIAGASTAVGVHFSTGVNASILNSSITAKGTGGTGTNTAVALATSSTKATIDSSTITATGTATQNNGVTVAPGTATILNSTVQVETAGTRIAVSTSASSNSTLKVFHSRLLASAAGSNSSELSLAHGNTSKLFVATSQLDSAATGDAKCVHIYDADMDDLNNTCPEPVA